VQIANLLTYYHDVQPITESLSDHHLTVTLDYAYADINRITIGYTVRGIAPAGQRMMAYSNPTLTTQDGQAINRLYLLAQQQDQSSQNERGEFSSTLTTNFNAKDLPAGASLSLHLMVEVALSYLDSAAPTAPAMLMAGNVTFAFSVPMLSGTVVTVGQSTAVAQHTISLQTVTITPSMTRLDMCYRLSPMTDVSGWSPFIQLSINGKQLFADHAETYEITTHCRAVIIPLNLQKQAGAWQVELVEFRDLSTVSRPIQGSWIFNFNVRNR